MNNTERIAEIEKRCEAATPGSWKHGNGSPIIFRDRCFIKCGDKLIIGLDGGLRENNADFIAHARDDIPYLLEENARVTAELNHKQSELEHLAKEMARLVTEGVEREKKIAELEAEVTVIARIKQEGGAKIAYDENHVPYLAEFEGSEAAHVIELLNAEVDGRLVVLPCKVGDKIFSVRWSVKNERYEAHTSEIKNVRYDSTDGSVMVSDGERFYVWGKHAFPARAEAEAALSAKEQNKCKP